MTKDNVINHNKKMRRDTPGGKMRMCAYGNSKINLV